jgi:hypothetical protein
MRRSLVAACAALAALTLLCVAAGAAAKANYNGVWVLDLSRSEGLPAGFEQTVTITQADDKLDLVIKQKTPQGERVINENHVLDGKEIEFKPSVAPNQPPPKNAKRVSKWTADGAGVEIVDNYDVDTPDGVITVVVKRTWRLAADGKTMTVVQDVKGTMGASQTKRVYNKQG